MWRTGRDRMWRTGRDRIWQAGIDSSQRNVQQQTAADLARYVRRCPQSTTWSTLEYHTATLGLAPRVHSGYPLCVVACRELGYDHLRQLLN